MIILKDFDTCYIGCYQNDACAGMTLYCADATACFVDCDDNNNITCPAIGSGSYQETEWDVTLSPTSNPSGMPSRQPSNEPFVQPSNYPSSDPTKYPSQVPSKIPSQIPTQTTLPPSGMPTKMPSEMPSKTPSKLPSNIPSDIPSNTSSNIPTILPSVAPTTIPTSATSATATSLSTSIASLNDDGESSAISSLMGSVLTDKTSTMVFVITLCVLFVCLVCCCWIMSFLFFKQISKSKHANHQEKSDISSLIELKKIQRQKSAQNAEIRVSKVKSVTATATHDMGSDTSEGSSHSISALFTTSPDENIKGETMVDIMDLQPDPDDVNDDIISDDENNIIAPGDVVEKKVEGAVADRLVSVDGVNVNSDINDDDLLNEKPITKGQVKITGGGGPGSEIMNIDESNYEKWTKKEVIMWVKENLINNGMTSDETKSFLKEFSKKGISGPVLKQLKFNLDNGDSKLMNQLKSEFSHKNQTFGIWVVLQTCIKNVGYND